MQQGEIVYTQSIAAAQVPGPKPPIRATFKADTKGASLAFLFLGQTKERLTGEVIKQVFASWGYEQMFVEETVIGLEEHAEAGKVYALLAPAKSPAYEDLDMDTKRDWIALSRLIKRRFTN